MRLSEFVSASPAENLAADEALLDLCEQSGAEALRFWSSEQPFVVLGYSGCLAEETHEDECRRLGIGIYRRCSGGGTVLQGPGCLNYSLVLRIAPEGPLRSITTANYFIMDKQRQAIETVLGKPVLVQGDTDLTLGRLKFSGNAQRRKRSHLLFHGTFLLDFDLGLIERTLAMPARQPMYRNKRSHADFLINLRVPEAAVREAVSAVWDVSGAFEDGVSEKARELARSRYSRDEWVRKF